MARRKIASSPFFGRLPDEIILEIFTNLKFRDIATASQVSKRWKLLSEDESVWKKINLSGRRVPAKFIEEALRRGCQYLSLFGTVIEYGSNYAQYYATFSAPNQLKYLSISCFPNYYQWQNWQVEYGFGPGLGMDSRHQLRNLLGASQSLEKLSIRFGNEYHNGTLPINCLIYNKLKDLRRDKIQIIFTNCLKLTEVSFMGCRISVGDLSFLCNHLPCKIKKLKFHGFCRKRLNYVTMLQCYKLCYILEDEHVIAITNRCPELEELDLGEREQNFISEVALAAIIEKLQNLVKLKLPNTDQIQFVKLLELRKMPKLKYLHLKPYLKRETPLIKALVKNLPNLKINEGKFEIATHKW